MLGSIQDIRAQLGTAGQEGRSSSCHLKMPTLHPCLQQELQPCPAVLVVAVREDKHGMGSAGQSLVLKPRGSIPGWAIHSGAGLDPYGSLPVQNVL